MVQVKWTFQARDDLRSIYEYIARDSRQYAKFQVIRLKNRTRILKTQPFCGHEVPEIGNEIFRQIIVDRYRIIYQVVNDRKVDILTIHHSSRDFNSRLQEFQ